MHATSPLFKRRTIFFAFFAVTSALSIAAQPGTRIWRCGNQYADQPCPNGTVITPAQGPSPEARTQSDAATRQAKSQADAMMKERERQEAAAAGRAPAVITHRSPWEEQTVKGEAPMTRTKRAKTQTGRNPKSDHFSAKGESTGQRKKR